LEFLDLPKISHSDKVWVFVRFIPAEKKQKFAIDVAESVLHIFEEKYPDDKRPREAIAAAKLFLKEKLSRREIAAAAAAARAAAARDAAAASRAAARDAAAAAFYAAAAATVANASYAAAAVAAARDADASYAAAAVANASYASRAADEKSRTAQLNLMKKYANLI
jgi:hypothetical protein